MAETFSNLPNPFRLHLGGQEPKSGWHIFDAQQRDGVDFIGDIRDLSRFPDACCDEIYASHIFEHLSYNGELINALIAVRRILKKQGIFKVGVPDMETLSHFLVNPALDADKKMHVMRIVFGSQVDDYDYHKSGFTFEILKGFLTHAGFTNIKRVESFGLFNDSTELRLGEHRISLNVEAS